MSSFTPACEKQEREVDAIKNPNYFQMSQSGPLLITTLWCNINILDNVYYSERTSLI